MNLSELALKRPVLATVMNILLVLFGVIGFMRLGVREYPAIDPPTVNVRTNYAGANAEIIKSQITEPLEKTINGIPGIRALTSTSSVGNSNITVEFDLSTDLESAANDVREKVSQAIRFLPQDIDAPPVVAKSDANSDFIIIMAIQSPNKSLVELSDYAENVLQNKFQTIPEVSAINIIGQLRPSMRLWVNPDKMNAYQIAFNDITSVLQKENIEIPSGKIYGNQTELTIRTVGRLQSEQDFRDMVIRSNEAGIVRLGDVARVEIAPENLERTWKLNGVTAVGLAVVPQPGANYVKISEEFDKRLQEITNDQKTSDLIFTKLIDNTTNIKKSLNEVKETLVISLSLVILVILFFFRNWKIAIRPLIDIPISLIATFSIMYFAGFSINILTLLGIVLATGLVVDDGIVVTENIFKKLEQGMPIKKAALEGSREIIFAIISTSLTLSVVFLPLLFLEGFVGSLFREFAVVVASAVLISAFVSLTITPVLNVLLTRDNRGHGKFYERTEPFFRKMESAYKNSLQTFVKWKFISIAIILACIGLIFWIGTSIQSELAPMEDRSTMRLQMSGPEGASFEYMRRVGNEVENFLIDSVPHRTFSFLSIPGFNSTGVNSGMGRIGLTAPQERDMTQSDIAKMVSKKLSRYNAARIFAIEEQTISVGLASRGALPIQFVLQNLDFEKLKNIIPEFVERARADKIFQNVDVNLKFNKPETEITFDRLKARNLGLTVQDISDVIQSAFSGRRLAYYISKGNQYQVISQVDLSDRQKPEDILKLYVRNQRGENIPLSAVIQMRNSASPPTLFQFNRYNAATISASLADGKTIGDGVKAMREIASQLLDDSFQTSLSGPSRDFEESSSNTLVAFVLALMLIYLILAAQFESFRDPFIIMITVPLALAGALLSLKLFGQTLNIFSQIGMITLIGLVTKNGILIVEFANQKREQGIQKLEATITAATSRLRPILMTSLATSLGALPIALSLGAAATSRVPLGVVIVGGILFSLLLTLYVIPSMYLLMSSPKHKHTDDF
ncbi:MAG: efflux RND transporter permease subunit [Saprospiraceae bacterium]|jgi:hydrophobe/amphiphile efflux-1 (HAE1) family protein|nr:efflux RND transporter permease subunit [Saprospiraceae bacterium]MBK7796834.1 efflux RND transporter permease subunit [Saprospiraceae bacterium]MBL0259786.1 efflux RND transporter permease subunit [Saprospiraceae bacterium]